MLKIALIGYGKMGKTIEALGLEKNAKNKEPLYAFPLIIDVHNRNKISAEDLSQVDVAIEFTSPHTVIDNIYWCFEANVPVVVGSTGWTDRLGEINSYAQENGKSFLFSPNYSIGVNIFFEINRHLADIMNDYTDYNVVMEEVHHTEKKDSPSGTGLFAALDVIARIDRKKNWVNEPAQKEEDLAIISKREPHVPGTHTVTYLSDIDEIELKHTAHSRAGFAAGALLAASWLHNKKGAYSMHDVLGF
jgi:4-hydroxy-tetrahydrodipicolinate reductase